MRLSVGINLKSSQNSIQLAEAYPDIFATIGFHPHEASKTRNDGIESLAEMARHPKVVAIGEIGLDFYRNRSTQL